MQANDACCDRGFQCCPSQGECCDDDCCVGSDCNGDPPPDGGGDGGSGGTNIVGSQDPNAKLSVGYGSLGWGRPDADLIYTIYFENVSTATAAAQQVFITDVLGPSLDWSSLELLDLGFNHVEVSVPPGLNHSIYGPPCPPTPTQCASGKSGRRDRSPDLRDRIDRQGHRDPPGDPRPASCRPTTLRFRGWPCHLQGAACDGPRLQHHDPEPGPHCL